MRKIDVDFRIFSGFIMMSTLCMFIILGLFFNYNFCASKYLKDILFISFLIGFTAGCIFVRKDEIGLEDFKYGILLGISSVIFFSLFLIQNLLK